MTHRASDGDFAVVETIDGRVYLGTVKFDREAGTVTIYPGHVGKPPVIELADVDSITHPDEHPDVEVR